ncbi:MAG: hypothetical protein U1E05_04580 [Patescibacteria group bacterium]|nr:hypothetical protein [Patescibacteria group bacterium]
MQQFFATLVVFIFAGLVMSIGVLFGRRGLKLGCHGQSSSGEGCGSSCSCSGEQRSEPSPLVTLEDHRK